MQGISPQKVLLLHEYTKSSPDIVFHCIQVARKALILGNRIQKQSNVEINTDLVYLGGLLHDIGRAKTHDIDHGIEGAKVIRKFLHNERLAKIAMRHIGGGISKHEAKKLGLPVKNYIPKTTEEKLVCYADKLFQYKLDKNDKIVSWQEYDTAKLEIEKLSKKLGTQHPTVKRLIEIEKTIMELLHGE